MRSFEERAAAGAALDIDVVQVETALLESRSLIIAFSRDAAVLKQEICAYLALADCENIVFENDEAIASPQASPTVPGIVALTANDRISRAHQSRKSAAELQRLSEWLGWLPALGFKGSQNKNILKTVLFFHHKMAGWSGWDSVGSFGMGGLNVIKS